MKVYLVQHGRAVSKEEDATRPLSDKGREDAERMAEHLARLGIHVERVIHSGKARARQTAEILGAAMTVVSPQPVGGINPKDSPDGMAQELRAAAEDTLIVGHQPFMSALVSLLLTNGASAIRTAYVPGTVVCMDRDEEGDWSMQWMLRPELVTSSS